MPAPIIPYTFFDKEGDLPLQQIDDNFAALAEAINAVPSGLQGPAGPQGGPGPQGTDGAVGQQGRTGTTGAAGSNTYFHVAYADNANGSVGFNQVAGTYIGTYVDANAADSELYTAYTWRLFRGAQGNSGTTGIPGTNGADGRTSYLHLKYSDDGGASFTPHAGEDVGAWLGQYVDFTAADSTDPAGYTWARIQGPTGLQGPQGTQGTAGPAGAPSYFHVAYANSSNGTVGFNQVSGSYIGTYVDANPADGTNPALYTWRLFVGAQGPQGTQGIAGTAGATGQTSYLHIKYSNDGGTTLTANAGEDVGSWIGTCVDFIAADSVAVDAYTWVRIQGAAGAVGPQGSQGVPGAAGASTFFHVAYADSADGAINFNQTTGAYIGTYVDNVAADSLISTAYTWQLLRGAQGPQGNQGISGTNGANGQTQYLHLKYSDDGGASFTANAGEDAGAWLGQYVDFVAADSTSLGAYAWSKIQGVPGEPGAPGSAGAAGAAGARGATQASAAIGDSAWSDAQANGAIAAQGFTSNVIGDRVTLYNSAASFVQTRSWNGSAWIPIAVVVDGNLLVLGSVTTASLAVGSVTAHYSRLSSGAGSFLPSPPVVSAGGIGTTTFTGYLWASFRRSGQAVLDKPALLLYRLNVLAADLTTVVSSQTCQLIVRAGLRSTDAGSVSMTFSRIVPSGADASTQLTVTSLGMFYLDGSGTASGGFSPSMWGTAYYSENKV